MTKQKFVIAITRKIPDIGIKMLKNKKYLLKINPSDKVLTKEELKNLVKNSDAILSSLTDNITGEIMDTAGPNLKIIANYTVGYDNIDLAEAKKRGIIVTNTQGTSARSVAEFTFALILACAKKIILADKFTRAEKYQGWTPSLFLGTNLAGKTLGIIGLGQIGQEVAKIAKGFCLKTIYFDSTRRPEMESKLEIKYSPLKNLLKIADIVSLHVPLLPETKFLINEKEFKLMKKNTILINTARGPIVEEKSLTRALKNKKIAFAGVDVYQCEPAIDCDVRDDLELKKLDNIVMTPHIASSTIEARNEMAKLATQNIINVLSGKKAITRII